MNREQATKLLPIIQAWVEGKDIECKDHLNLSPHWLPITCQDNHYFSHTWEYRIKPEVKDRWANVYGNRGPSVGTVWLTKELADANQAQGRTACIKFTYTEGEGL